jgi:uncharacterized protein
MPQSVSVPGNLGSFRGVINDPPDWKSTGFLPLNELLSNASTGIGNAVLFQWGPLQFKVQPFNVNEVDHETSAEWAKKEIVGAALYREWVGEGDEQFHFRGNLFPYRLGGVWNLEALEAMRRAGMAHMLVRGMGEILGWYVCEHLTRSHTMLSTEGMGRQLGFDATFTRMPTPAAPSYFSSLWSTVGAAPL